MDKTALKEIFEKVYKKFPEVNGKRPTQHAQPNGQTLLIFKGSGKTPDGNTIDRIVRVLVNDKGKIVKITTSR